MKQPGNELSRIISGGQSGVDRGALDGAMARDMPVGGWCPEGRRAEDGPIDDVYPLNVLAGAGYRERTRKNVQDSDATLIIHFQELVGGTRLTRDYCHSEGKPFLLVDGTIQTPQQAACQVLDFIRQHGVRVLNVAGPRASGEIRAYGYARKLVSEVVGRAGDNGHETEID